MLAGCGGGAHRAAPAPKPKRIPADIATKLADDANRIANAPAHSCTARDAANALLEDVISSTRRIPARYRETLTSTANDLALRLSACAQRVDRGRPKHEKKEKKKHKKEHG